MCGASEESEVVGGVAGKDSSEPSAETVEKGVHYSALIYTAVAQTRPRLQGEFTQGSESTSSF